MDRLLALAYSLSTAFDDARTTGDPGQLYDQLEALQLLLTEIDPNNQGAFMQPQQIIDAMFAGLLGNRFIRFIPSAEAMVKRAQSMVASGELALKLTPNMTWQQVVDAVFAALETALPSDLLILKVLQAMVDALFTAVPKAA